MKSLRGYPANYSPISYEDVDMTHLNYEEENTPKNYLEQIRYLLEEGNAGGYVSAFDRGFSGGLGRKVGGFINAVGSYPVDRAAEWLGYENVPSFYDRYDEIVQQADASEQQLREEHPYAAMGTEMLGSAFGLGNAAYGIAGRYGLNGITRMGSAGAIDAAVNTFGGAENLSDAITALPLNTIGGYAGGAVMGKLGELGAKYGGQVLDWGQNKFRSNLNNRMQGILTDTSGHSINIPEIAARRQQIYDNFVFQNADKEVLDFGNPNMYGRQDLINQLKSGNYSDIPFGSMQENVRQQVNNIRMNNGEIPLNPDMIIPANVVRKWGGNRLNENYSPEKVAQIADEVFHSPDVRVFNGDYPHIQKLLKERAGHHNDYTGFISQNNKTGDTVIKTVYQTKRKGLAGRQPASLQDNPVGRKRLSDLQTSPYYKNVLYEKAIVNKNLPNVSGLYNELTPRQVEMMDNVLRQGLGQSAHKAGTLDSMDKIRRAANVQNGSSADLAAIKGNINNVMRPHTGQLDDKLAQIKRMKQYYRQGYQNQPIMRNASGQQFHNNVEKQAYLQGQLHRLSQGDLVARDVLDNQAILQPLMTDKRYNRLYSEAQYFDDAYRNLLELRAKYAQYLRDMYNKTAPHAVNDITQKRK